MAVYTHITEEALRDHLARYDLGELLSFEGISEGVENTNYRIDTSEGRFILTLFEKRADADELPFYIDFMEYIRQSGIPAPRTRMAKTGEKIVTLAGKPSVIVSFLEGVWSREPTATQCLTLGRALGRLHVAGRAFPAKRKNSMGPAAWATLIHACRDDADKVEKGLGESLLSELSFLEKHWPKFLQRGTVHADLFPDNVFFLGDDISGVIDFYFACTESLCYDLMLTLNAWCFRDGVLDVEKSRALLKGYQEIRQLGRAEVRAMRIMGRAAAVRIISTRLYDWLNPVTGALVKPKDPMEHVKILRFHQQAKSAGDYGLEVT